MLCVVCRRISTGSCAQFSHNYVKNNDSPFSNDWGLHHDRFDSFHDSAQRGCYICEHSWICYSHHAADQTNSNAHVVGDFRYKYDFTIWNDLKPGLAVKLYTEMISFEVRLQLCEVHGMLRYYFPFFLAPFDTPH